MTEAMPFLQKAILLSYDPLPFGRVFFLFVSSAVKKFFSDAEQKEKLHLPPKG